MLHSACFAPCDQNQHVPTQTCIVHDAGRGCACGYMNWSALYCETGEMRVDNGRCRIEGNEEEFLSS